MIETSNIIWKNVSLTDEVKINLQYDIHHRLLNIFIKNIGNNNNQKFPCHINVLSEESEFISNSISSLEIEDYEPKICYEISTTYIYDIIDENEHVDQIDFSQTMLASSVSLSSSSYFDDDGYSTHSHDDIEQQQQQHLSLVIPSSKLILPSFSYSEQYISSIQRLIEKLTWLNPFKKTIQQMMIMMNHRFV